MQLYGIANCDTVKRARAWLAQRGVAHRFEDFKKTGVDATHGAAWLQALGAAALINRQGTTWRRLSDAERQAVVDDASALALMCAQPSVVKRPVVEWDDGAITVGFDPEDWARRIGAGG